MDEVGQMKISFNQAISYDTDDGLPSKNILSIKHSFFDVESGLYYSDDT
jgi:hypothetical protein